MEKELPVLLLYILIVGTVFYIFPTLMHISVIICTPIVLWMFIGLSKYRLRSNDPTA